MCFLRLWCRLYVRLSGHVQGQCELALTRAAGPAMPSTKLGPNDLSAGLLSRVQVGSYGAWASKLCPSSTRCCCSAPGYRSCDRKGCKSRYHISCLDPSLEVRNICLWNLVQYQLYEKELLVWFTFYC